MFWMMIVWTTVQVVFGLLALLAYLSFWQNEARTDGESTATAIFKSWCDLDYLFESAWVFWFSLGLIAAPIWMAVNVYPDQDWQLGFVIAAISGVAGMVLVCVLNLAFWIPVGFAKAVLYVMRGFRSRQQP